MVLRMSHCSVPLAAFVYEEPRAQCMSHKALNDPTSPPAAEGSSPLPSGGLSFIPVDTAAFGLPLLILTIL